MNLVHQLEVECQGKQTLKILITEKQGQRKKRKIKTWSSKQDQKLLQLYGTFPKKWTLIAGMMNDRNENQCLHRYRRLIMMENGHKIWSQEEDQMVISLIKKVGKNWKVISEIMKTKNGKQIRQRYINKLDPKINLDQWSQQQDLLLISLYIAMGSKWSQIAKKLPGRPENRIKNRFYSYIKRVYNISNTSEKSSIIEQINNVSTSQSPSDTEKTKIQQECLSYKKDEQSNDVLSESKSMIYYGQDEYNYSPQYVAMQPLDFLIGFNFPSIYQ